MSHRLIVLPQARADVLRNAEWWAHHHSSEQAAIWLDAIQSQLESLSEFPESCARSAEEDTFPYEIRDKLLGLGSRPSYRAVFTIEGTTIYVLTVLRSAQGTLHPSDVEPPPSA